MADKRSRAATDREEILDLLMTWGYSRDRGEWEMLRNCFHTDGTIHIAWISGTGSEFVDKSSKRLAEYEEGEYEKHVFSPPYIQLNGKRAISTIHVQHISRVIVDGREFDWDFWGQFHDLIEKREDGIWRLFRRTMVYERDRLDPVHPERLPGGYFDDIEFNAFRSPVRFLDWRLKKFGVQAATSIVTINTVEESELIKNKFAWLQDAG